MGEPFAYAKLATRGDVLPPFYIRDEHVKAKDANGVPTQIEIVLGRSPPQPQPGQPALPTDSYTADYHIGSRMKISKRHAMIYWSEERQSFCIRSICKNAVKVNGQSFPGSPEGNAGTEAPLCSQAAIEIADSGQIYFLLPKSKQPALTKPKQTYEMLAQAVMGHEQLTLDEIINRIKDRHPYFQHVSLENLRTALRQTLNIKKESFTKVNGTDAEGKKIQYFKRNVECTSAPGVTAGSASAVSSSFAGLPAGDGDGGPKRDSGDVITS